MGESNRKVLITPDPTTPGWFNAAGRNLLAALRDQPWVQATPSGISFHKDFAAEVRASLVAAGYRLVDAQGRSSDQPTPAPRRGTHGFDHMRYVSDADDLTILPDDSPGGHWQDESNTCPRCNPAHAATNALVRADAMRTIRANLARMKQPGDDPAQSTLFAVPDPKEHP